MRARKNPSENDPLIRAHCFDCGTVEVEPRSVVLVLRNTDPGTGYYFVCPKCQARVHYDGCSRDAVKLLAFVGVNIKDECIECLEHDGQPPLTEDDADRLVKSIEHLRYIAAYARRESVAYRKKQLQLG